MSGGTIAGLGAGGTIIVVLLSLFLGRNPQDVLQQMQQQQGATTQTEREFTQEEQELADFASKILASTEDVWTEVFKKMGRTYKAPTMVLYTDAVSSGCGNATSAVGPFYCSADECLYIDLSFFSTMKQQLGADGDFAYAYVIAHEVGHHVQHLLGTLDQAHAQMSRMNSADANKISVRIELQADFYAGIWGYYENQTFKSLDDGDLKEAIDCAAVIGDDYLQKKATGGFNPESFTHGTSDQRMKWLKRGLTTGDMSLGDTFSVSESQL
jgi:predicted metalloprotease